MITSQRTVTAAFDDAAKTYDLDFTFSGIGKLQRERVHLLLTKKILREKKISILEINCGTGWDALWFAEKGHEVIATDGSSGMIEAARHKAFISDFGSLAFEQAEFRALKEKYAEQSFDLIFSDFGGLNCVNEEELKKLFDDFSSLLNPNGKLVFVIMGRKCLWERMYFLMKGNSKGAFRRMAKQAVPAHIGEGVMQNIYYFSPNEIKNLTKEKFKHLATNPVGFFVPPSYLEKFFSNKKILLRFLFRLEKICSEFSFLSNYADHYYISFEK